MVWHCKIFTTVVQAMTGFCLLRSGLDGGMKKVLSVIETGGSGWGVRSDGGAERT